MITLQTEIPVFMASDVTEPLHRLAAHLKAHSAYARFFDAYRAMHDDVKAQSLLAELRAHQYQGQGVDADSYHQLLQQFSAWPSVRAYQAAEEELHDLMQALDAVISEAAGIAFAANARRSCCGG
ncbi:MAG TPA: YlbF family regulator [Chloroflexota bacterium]|nr:YlbF family regulator [Chloroflexota bacterium]